MKKYLYWYGHRELYVPHDTMVERIIGSTSNSNNMHEVVDDNSNPYRNIVMDTMKMYQSYVVQCPIVNKELNADATMFFDLLKDSDKPL